jgi:hypothetical protein
MATFIETFGNRTNLGNALKIAANPNTDWDFVAFPGPAGMMLASDRVIFLADPDYFADSSPVAGELFKRAGSKLKATGERLDDWETRTMQAKRVMAGAIISLSKSPFYVDSPDRVNGFGRYFFRGGLKIAARMELVRLIEAARPTYWVLNEKARTIVALNVGNEPVGAVKGWVVDSETPDA